MTTLAYLNMTVHNIVVLAYRLSTSSYRTRIRMSTPRWESVGNLEAFANVAPSKAAPQTFMAGLQAAAGRLAAAENPSIFEAGSDAQCSRRQSRQPTWKYLIEMTRLSSSPRNSISACVRNDFA